MDDRRKDETDHDPAAIEPPAAQEEEKQKSGLHRSGTDPRKIIPAKEGGET